MEKLQIKLAEDHPRFGKAGSLVTLAAEPTDTFDPTEMAPFLMGYRNENLRADAMSPVIPVDKEVGKYRVFDRADAFQRVDVRMGHEDEVRQINFRSSLVDYRLQWKGIGAFVNDITEAQEGPNIRTRQSAAKRCMKVIAIDRELEVTTLLSTSANWNASYVITLNGSTKWNAGASKDVLGNLHTALEQSDQDITGFHLNRKVANLMLKDSSIRDQMRQFLGDATVNTAIQQVNDPRMTRVDFIVPGLPPFHVHTAKVRDDSADTLGFILPDDVIGVCQPPGTPTDGEDIATSYTLRLRSGGIVSREYRVDGRGPKGGTMLVVSVCDQPVFTGTTVGALIKGCIQ